MKKKAVVIMNPVSGMKMGKRYLADILYLFAQDGYESLCLMTQKRGDGEALAREHAQGADMVVCIGGDGTYTEVAAGVIASGTGTPIGYIPAGSTNDFANSLKLSRDIMTAAKDILCGTPQSYDMCRFGERYFSYIASFGAFTRASYSAPQNMKNMLGHMAYILEGMRELSSLRSEHVIIEMDNGTVLDDYYLFGGFCNSTSVGGIITLDPKIVDMNDGLFEILLVKAPRNTMELTECVRALTEQDYHSEILRLYSTSHAKITTAYTMDWSLDGEHVKSSGTVDLFDIKDAVRILKA